MFPVRKILRQDQNKRVFLPNTSKGKNISHTRDNRGVTLIADSSVFEIAIHHCGPLQQLPFKKESKN